MVKVYVGNLSEGVKNTELRSMFEQFGQVNECSIIGSFAFVHMEKVSESQSAIEALNGIEMEGSKILVEFSRGAPAVVKGSNYQDSRRGRRGGGRGRQGNHSYFDPRGGPEGDHQWEGNDRGAGRRMGHFETYEPRIPEGIPMGSISDYFYTDSNGMTRDPTIRPPPEYYYRYRLLRERMNAARLYNVA